MNEETTLDLPLAPAKDWTGNSKSMFATLGASNHSNLVRVNQDYYATEPTAIDDLLQVEEISPSVWEPACGEGHLSKRLEHFGHKVYSTDLINRGYGNGVCDFLGSNTVFNGDIITNPPYNLGDEFVRQSMKSCTGKVAMFLKLTFLEGQKRNGLFKTYPPRRVWVYSKHKTVARNGDEAMFKASSAACYAWFVWEHDYKGMPEIGWIS